MEQVMSALFRIIVTSPDASTRICPSSKEPVISYVPAFVMVAVVPSTETPLPAEMDEPFSVISPETAEIKVLPELP